jgi:hypothetical protein
MKRLQLITALSLISLLSACGGAEPVAPNKNLYGTWVETQTKGELVFRENRTVNWNGIEGTYDFYIGPVVNYHDVSTGGTPRIRVELPEQNISIKSHGPVGDSWEFRTRTFLRKGSFEVPTMPSNFEFIPNKLASGFYSDNNFDTTTISFLVKGSGDGVKVSSNQLIYEKTDHQSAPSKEYYRFDKELRQWVNLSEIQFPNHDRSEWKFSPKLIYLNSYLDDDVVSSVDGGITWKTVPSPNANHGGSSSSYHAVGTDIFYLKWVEVNMICKRKELWVLDATSEQPIWEMRSTFSCDDETKIQPFLDQALVRGNYISYDRGLSWTDWTPAPRSYSYARGYMMENECELSHYERCENDAGEKTLHWYNVDTQTWSTHTVNFNRVLGVTPNRDGVYFKRGQEIHKWSPDGTETLITTLPSGNFDASVVGNDLYVSTIFGLWRMDL